MRQVTLYTRVGCHLCDVAKELLDRVQKDTPFGLEVIDVDSSPALKAQYDWEVPVVLVDGKKAAKLRVDEAALRRRLREEPA
jgi:glutaredoxin